ncbi:MAG: RecQ family zinc-binding domain-containing protein [Flavobacteriales bacterium]|nr:RecQ family zinc-binding domain-containing protein [Flavobacteriales bacterium]
MNSVIRYVQQGEGCRSNSLLQYFGEQGSNKCGQCDLCTAPELTTLAAEFDLAKKQLILILKKEPITLKELQLKVISENEPEHLVNVVQWLLDNKTIKLDELNRLCTN